MDSSTVTAQIIDILKEEFPTLSDMDIEADTALLSSGLIDSFAMVTVLSLLEEKFAVSIEPNSLEIALFENPASIATVVTDKKYRKA